MSGDGDDRVPKRITGEELGPCVFCTGQLHASISPEDGAPDGLIHTMPMCQRFEELEPDEFLRQTNAVLERRAMRGGWQ